MDKFVTVTKKSKIDDSTSLPENPNSDDNSSHSSTSQKSETSKRKSVVRKFNLQWESDYFATEHKGKTICLVCRIEFSDNKKYTIERHFTSQHGDKNTKFLDPTKRNFPTFDEHCNICFIEDKKDDQIRFIKYIDVLIDEFDTRFADFKKHDLAFKFLKNPFDFDSAKITELSKIFQVKTAQLEFDFAVIAQESHLKNLADIDMWKRLILENSFLVLNDVVPKYVCMFSSTYVCECTFSSLVRRKTKYRTMLSQESLESEIRCELCTTEPNFAEMAESKKCNPSHGTKQNE